MQNPANLFYYFIVYRVLVCREYATGVFNFKEHLLKQHKAVQITQRKAVLSYFSNCARANLKDILLPTPG
jgi:hypothetical protein